MSVNDDISTTDCKLRVLDLFSGIGGFSLGLERAGMKTVAFCEIEKFPQAVIRKHWPNVPIYDDIRILTADKLRSDGIGTIDVICGGFPCQDISVAGKGAGIEGERSGLWKEYSRLIDELRPQYVIVENVSALLSRGLGVVLGDLASIGYDAEWHCIPASAIGAPHKRDRVWIIAYTKSNRHIGNPSTMGKTLITNKEQKHGAIIKCEIKDNGGVGECDEPNGTEALPFSNPNDMRLQGRQSQGNGSQGMPEIIIKRCVKSGIWDNWKECIPSPRICRADDGISDRTHRLKALGNAVVPQIPELIGRAIMENHYE